MPRWALICQDCWYVLNGDQYFPDEPRGGYGTGCDACGEDMCLSVSVHPDIVVATIRVAEAATFADDDGWDDDGWDDEGENPGGSLNREGDPAFNGAFNRW